MKTPFLLNRENEAGVGLKVSPNTGTNVYYYDSAGNLIKRVAATSAVTQYTYDALDRVLTTFLIWGVTPGRIRSRCREVPGATFPVTAV